jgi:ATP phosphoribosyltransferase
MYVHLQQNTIANFILNLRNSKNREAYWLKLLHKIDGSRMEDNNVQLIIHAPSAKTDQTYEMLPELSSQTEKKHRNRSSQWLDIYHTRVCNWNGAYICFM